MNPGDVAWIVVLGGILIYELWATFTGRQTMSMSVWDKIRKRRWLSWIVIGALAVLMIHLTAPALNLDDNTAPLTDCAEE